MDFGALRQEAFPPPLAPARKSGAAPLCLHAGAETVLAFARALRALESAFHGERERLK